MARLPYVTAPDELELERVQQIYSQIRGYGRSVAHLYQVLANQPAALDAFMGMSHYVRDSSSLPPALREIAILATAQALAQPYEIAHHRPAAVKAGVSVEKIDAILAATKGSLSPVERSVVDYAREAARHRNVDDGTFDVLRSHFTNAEIIDLVLTVAWYHLCAAVLGPLRVEIEPELQADHIQFS